MAAESRLPVIDFGNMVAGVLEGAGIEPSVIALAAEGVEIEMQAACHENQQSEVPDIDLGDPFDLELAAAFQGG